MKTFLQTVAGLVVIAIAFFGLSESGVFAAPCDSPLLYHLDDIDERFDLSENKAKTLLLEAESAWEQASGRDLFSLTESEGVAVSFVYDQRQAETDAVTEAEASLDNLAGSHDNLTGEIASERATYQRALDDFETQSQNYENDLEALNEDIETTNANGGATQDEADQFQARQNNLERRRENLESERAELNDMKASLNELVAEANNLASSYNDQADDFNEEFAGERAFDQATYQGSDGINIYQFQKDADLRLAMAHELGHALGLDHTDDPKSVMYYLMEDQPTDEVVITEADQTELARVCEK